MLSPRARLDQLCELQLYSELKHNSVTNLFIFIVKPYNTQTEACHHISNSQTDDTTHQRFHHRSHGSGWMKEEDGDSLRLGMHLFNLTTK